jgi:hypothetical protein
MEQRRAQQRQGAEHGANRPQVEYPVRNLPQGEFHIHKHRRTPDEQADDGADPE